MALRNCTRILIILCTSQQTMECQPKISFRNHTICSAFSCQNRLQSASNWTFYTHVTVAPLLWNSLSIPIRKWNSLQVFKKSVKTCPDPATGFGPVQSCPGKLSSLSLNQVFSLNDYSLTFHFPSRLPLSSLKFLFFMILLYFSIQLLQLCMVSTNTAIHIQKAKVVNLSLQAVFSNNV